MKRETELAEYDPWCNTILVYSFASEIGGLQKYAVQVDWG